MWKQSYRLTKTFQSNEFKGPLRVAISIKTKLQKFRLNLPIIHVVANPGLKKRHWQQISLILGSDIIPNDKTTLNDILKYSFLFENNLAKLNELADLAGKEFSIEQAFTKMKNDWNKIEFKITENNETKLCTLGSFEDIFTLLEDHLVKTTTMKNSPFIFQFKSEVLDWYNKLHRMKNILDNLTKVQKAWLYLDPIFNSSDLRDQMMDENRFFTELNTIWCDIIEFLKKDLKPLNFIAKQKLLDNLEHCVYLYESIYRGILFINLKLYCIVLLYVILF